MKKKFANRERINQEPSKILQFMGQISKDMLYILIIAACNRISQNIANNVQYQGELDYSDAVKAISESDMFSGDKARSISLVKSGENAAYYRAITTIARERGMFSHDKYKAIADVANGKGGVKIELSI